jgi:hypothetical protein
VRITPTNVESRDALKIEDYRKKLYIPIDNMETISHLFLMRRKWWLNNKQNYSPLIENGNALFPPNLNFWGLERIVNQISIIPLQSPELDRYLNMSHSPCRDPDLSSAGLYHPKSPQGDKR